MGTVFRARGADGEVALELLTDRTDDQRFEREAQVLGERAHPGLAGVRGAGVQDGVPWLALELVQGRTAAQLIAGGAQPWPEVARIGAKLCEALGYLHEREVLHRDLSAGNVMVTADGAKILDFGLAKEPDMTAVTRPGSVMGTPLIMAPELITARARFRRPRICGRPDASSTRW